MQSEINTFEVDLVSDDYSLNHGILKKPTSSWCIPGNTLCGCNGFQNIILVEALQNEEWHTLSQG